MEPVAESTTYPSHLTGSLSFSGKGYINNIEGNNAQSPIFILLSGQYLNFRNSTPVGAALSVRGFLVDDLNY